MLLFADEAFFAGDKQHESVLKMLITEDTIPIEHKGVDVEAYPNYVHMIMASNDPHVIRATGDERRYFVLKMDNAQQQNEDYFEAIYKQMDNGGYEALLYHLQSLDLSNFSVRKVPQTEALKEQKDLSMTPEENWWYEKLVDGRVLQNQADWTPWVKSDAVTEDFLKYAEKWKLARRGNPTSFGRFMHSIVPHLDRAQKSITEEFYDPEQGRNFRATKRHYHYYFGTLQECRDAWEKLHGEFDWPDAIGPDTMIDEQF